MAAGTTALVGADNSFGEVAGAAYVFARTGSVWSQRQVLSASDAVDGDDYGVSVAISADGTIEDLTPPPWNVRTRVHASRSGL